MGIQIEGVCPDRFQGVRDAFERNFTDRGDVGAAAAVTVDGELVVDLWGGVADASSQRPWEQDTLVNVYSSTKGATALCAHILVDRGELDLDAPVAQYWPEFAQAGKEEIPVRWLLSHRAGLMGPRRQLEPDDIFDWDRVCTALAESEPWFEPGTAAAYHGITFGFLVGEIVRRVSGLPVGQFLRVNVTEPLGIEREVYIGCPPSEQGRCAELIGTIGADPDNPMLTAAMQAFMVNLHPSLASFGHLPVPFDNNSVAWRAAEIPAANGQMTARGLATIYGPLANGGEWHGTRIVSPEAIERMRERQGDGDLLISAMGVPDFSWLSGFMPTLGFGSNPRAFGHSGAGGSYGFADPENRISFAYVMNKMAMITTGVDERVIGLTKALYDAVGAA